MSAHRLESARDRQWLCAQRLRGRRLALGLTQHELAERLRQRGRPVTNRTLSAMEHCQGLDLGMLPELADALDCTVTYLLGLTLDPSAWQPDSSMSSEARPR
ncbi:helix-turn-helix transcriptional regulator [Nonomuraea sp. NPDC050643]|uniref:helix-turn-helix domain-containing protein n=1 Tax=Nonomuraea sp. NPDC050643 TaxID=3155660 RepID=UPI0033E63DB8